MNKPTEDKGEQYAVAIDLEEVARLADRVRGMMREEMDTAMGGTKSNMERSMALTKMMGHMTVAIALLYRDVKALAPKSQWPTIEEAVACFKEVDRGSP